MDYASTIFDIFAPESTVSLKYCTWLFHAMVQFCLLTVSMNKHIIWRPWSPFYWHGIALIPTWTSNFVHYLVWYEITYPFLNFNGGPVEVWEWISNFFTHLSMLTSKINHVNKRGPWKKKLLDYQAHCWLQSELPIFQMFFGYVKPDDIFQNSPKIFAHIAALSVLELNIWFLYLGVHPCTNKVHSTLSIISALISSSYTH